MPLIDIDGNINDKDLDDNFDFLLSEINNLKSTVSDLNLNKADKLEIVRQIDLVASNIVNDTAGVSGYAVSNALLGLKNRIDNIIAQSGTSDTEVVDARFDSVFNTTYTVLTNRLDAMSQYAKDINTEVTNARTDTVYGTTDTDLSDRLNTMSQRELDNSQRSVYTITDVTNTNDYVGNITGLTLFDDLRLDLEVTNPNTGSATLDIGDGGGSKPIKFINSRGSKVDLPIGVLYGVNQLKYDGIEWILLNNNFIETLHANTNGLNVLHPPSGLEPLKGDANYFDDPRTGGDGNYYTDETKQTLATDDTLALQSIINYAKTSNVNTIYFPKGNYQVNRKVGEYFCFEIRDIDNLKLVGDKARIVSNTDFTNEDINVLLIRNVSNVDVTGFEFDIRVYGEPTTGRKNGRIIWVSASDGLQASFDNVKIYNNVFKIEHETGAGTDKDLYGTLVAAAWGETYQGKNAWVFNNTYKGIDGRNIELNANDTVKVFNNIIENIGENELAVGIRVLNRVNDCSIFGNTISSKLQGNAFVELIQISTDILANTCENIKIFGNTLLLKSDNGIQNCIRVNGATDVKIVDNHMENTFAENEASKRTNGILIDDILQNKNVNILDNTFKGFVNYSIKVDDTLLDGCIIDKNYFGSTFFGVSGRDILDSNNLTTIKDNYTEARDLVVNNRKNKIVDYSDTIPSGTAIFYNVGDVVFNTSPVAGGTIGWVCTSSGAPGTWKTFGTIEV